MDASIYRVLCMGGPLLCNDDQSVIKPPEEVSFESLAASSPPLILRGYLRRPDGAGPFPAVVLLHGCNGAPKVLDRNWGPRIAGWGYVTLTVDAFGPRGRKNACTGGPPQDMGYDAYSALRFLVRQSFVDPKRVFVVGFSLGGLESLNAVERGPIEQGAANKFLAAAAFYPVCTGVNGPMTVSTLILTGEADDWTVADACRKLVAGQDDLGVSRRGAADGPPIQLIIYPGAFHGFDVPMPRPINYFGHHIEFSQSATDQSREALHQFLQARIDGGK
jgi:dienelactone hydrolase